MGVFIDASVSKPVSLLRSATHARAITIHSIHRQRSRNNQIRRYIPRAIRELGPDTSPYLQGEPKEIAIIGGGISGLATAYFIHEKWTSSYFRRPRVTIYESSDQLGGWIGSEKVETPTGHIMIERGPRTLAASPAGRATMDVIEHIGILDSVRWVKKDDPSAQNRYIYDGGDELRRVPTTPGAFFWDLCIKDSLMMPAVKHCFSHLFKKIGPFYTQPDINLGSAIAALVGLSTAQTLVSSFIHGIYAGDIWDLSPRAKGPWSTILKQLQYRSKSLWDIINSKPDPRHQPFWIGTEASTPSWSKNFDESFVFYMKEGLQILPLALESHLRMQTKTDLIQRAQVQKISSNHDASISVAGTKNGKPFKRKFDYVVSAIPPNHAHKILDPPPPWEDMKSASVGVVTFFWPDKFPIEYDGFGYVISQATPTAKNPHGALGVIFDSSTRPSQDKAAGQKVTVLLGGEYWAAGLEKGKKLPSREELISQAEDTLAIQLGVSEKAEFITASIMPQCIPQPTVEFMNSTHTRTNPAVRTWAEKWNDRLLLTGPPVFGPGVHDCIGGAYTTASQIMMNELYTVAKKSGAPDKEPEDNMWWNRYGPATDKKVSPDPLEWAYAIQLCCEQLDLEYEANKRRATEDRLTGGKDMLWPPPWRGPRGLYIASSLGSIAQQAEIRYGKKRAG